MSNMYKICSKCGESKPISEFSVSRKGVTGNILRGECNTCKNEYQRDFNKNNPGKFREYKRTYSQNHPMRIWVHNALKSHRRKGFVVNVTPQFVFDLAIDTPNCKYCGNELDYTTISGKRKFLNRNNVPTIDRIDCGISLDENNVEIICLECNSTKLGRSRQEFYEYCKNVVSVIENKGEE